jgi:hypothetical protein
MLRRRSNRRSSRTGVFCSSMPQCPMGVAPSNFRGCGSDMYRRPQPAECCFMQFAFLACLALELHGDAVVVGRRCTRCWTIYDIPARP